MNSSRHVNPDHYLETEGGRVFTPERNEAAWNQAYSDLELILRTASPDVELFVVVGVQGSGKSTWIEENACRLGPQAVFFDAALPARAHRERIVALARESGVPAVAVWLNTPLEQALARNSARPPDKQVPEFAVRNVFSMLERPTQQEGFVQVIEVSAYEPGV